MMMKILICEDNDVDRKVIQMALEHENVKTVFARDGKEAMKHLNENNDFGLIITDIHMPHHNGDDILILVRKQQKKNIPIVIISSDGDDDVIKMALKLGANEFIEKPIDLAQVRKKLRKFLVS